MGYTARQLHCLEHMGIVAWVQVAGADSADAGASLSEAAVVGTESSQSCHSIQTLSAQVLAGLLQSFPHQGKPRRVFGHNTAPLLVVSETDPRETGTVLFADEELRLFDMMMSAIGCSRSAWFACAVADSASRQSSEIPETPGNDDPRRVLDMLGQQTRAMLYLSRAFSDTQFAEEHCRIEGSQCRFFRVSHPAELLKEPLRKRAAWKTLKRLKQVLESS